MTEPFDWNDPDPESAASFDDVVREVRRIRIRQTRAFRAVVAFVTLILVGVVLSIAGLSHLTREDAKHARQESADNHALIVQLQAAEARIRDEAKSSALNACAEANGVRAGARNYIASLTVNSQRNYEVTLTSPTATPAQKATAQANLATIQSAQHKADVSFADEKCKYPTKP